MEYTPEGRSVERSILQGASRGAERSILHKMPERSEFRSAPAFFTIFEYPKFFGHHRRPKSTPKNFSAPSAAEKYPKIFWPPSAAEKYPPKFFFHCRSGRSGAVGAVLRSEARSGVYSGKKYSPERSILQWAERSELRKNPERTSIPDFNRKKYQKYF